MKNPFEMLFGGDSNSDAQVDEEEPGEEIQSKRKRIRHQLEMGELEDHMVTIEIEDQAPSSMFDMLQGSGMEQMGANML